MIDPADIAIDAAMAELFALNRAKCLIVTCWPGQAEGNVHPAPKHLKQQIDEGRNFPFVRRATQQETQDYGLANNLLSGELTKALTKEWGSW